MSQALIVFVKEPIAGKVKTRLGKNPLSLENSSDLYTAFLKDSFVSYKQLSKTDIIYFYVGNLIPLKKLLPEQTIWCLQSNGDLGEKMSSAFSEILVKYKKVVIVGSDHPDLPLTYLKKAFDVLSYVDVSIGNSDDGGYYCIGLKKPQSQLFTYMKWSVESVYAETQKRIEQSNLELFELPEWYDIDEFSDLKRFIESNDLSKYPTINSVIKSISEISGL